MTRRPIPSSPFSLRDFLQQESAGGLILIAAAALALIVANGPLAAIYAAALDTPLGPLNLHHWINDGLMALFFLLVGLEIKREALTGALATWKQRVLPCVAAAGGMIAPALIFVALNASDPARLRGWAVPAATDIAFALAILALLGSRAPTSLKIFLSALAILDDLGAVAIIALFYTSALSPLYLALSALTFAALLGLNRFGVTRLWPYLLLGALLWVLVLKSGVHPTVAGVALAFAIPAKGETPALNRLEHWLSPWAAFFIAPVFAFANAGLDLRGVGAEALRDTLPLGIAAGLFIGKQIGVFGAIWTAIKLGWAQAPAHATWRQLYGVAMLCGIGFTMSLFIGFLAFPSPLLQEEAKLGVLAGSLASALLGYALLRFSPPSRAT